MKKCTLKKLLLLCAVLLLGLLPCALAQEMPAQTDLEIMLDSPLVYVGERSRMGVTVRYSANVTSDIVLKNDLDETIFTQSNDGSGEAEIVLYLRESEIRTAYLVAEYGETQSEKAYYRVQPRITRQMTQTLSDVCADMIAALNAANMTAPDSDEAKALVRNFLKNDARVESYGDNNGAILFRTTDGLLGFYGFHESGEMVFSDTQQSFITAQEAFEQYEGGTLAKDALIESEIPLTNSNIFFLSPQNDDTVINWGRSAFDPRLRVLATEANFNYRHYAGADAIEAIFNGDFTDCGLLVFMAHGGQLFTSDGFMLTIKLGEVSQRHASMVADLMWEAPASHMYTETNEYTQNEAEMAQTYYVNSESVYVLCGVSYSSDEYHYDMTITRNLLEHVLQGKLFDNTVAYFVVCHAASDANLREMLFDHGASAFISTLDPLQGSVSFCGLESICRMTLEMAENTYLTLQEAMDLLHEAPSDETLTAYYQSLQAMNLISDPSKSVQDFITEERAFYEREQLSNALNLYPRTIDCSGRVWLGEDSLRGRVVDMNKQPVEGAEVFFYRWLDHTFQRAPKDDISVKTDADGYYVIDGLPYGWYGVKAKKAGAEGFVTVKVDGAKDEPDDIVLLRNDVIVTTTIENSEDDIISTFVVRPQVHIKGNQEAADRINASIDEMYGRLAANIRDLRGQRLQGSSKHAYNLEISGVHASGTLLFLTFHEYRYGSGAARGVNLEYSLAFNLKSGEQALGKDILPQDYEKRNALISLFEAELDRTHRKNLFTTPRDVAAKAATGKGCTLEISQQGLTAIFNPGDVAPNFCGSVQATVPFEALADVLDEKYLPAPVEGTGTASISFSAAEAAYGTPGAAVLVSDGETTEVTASVYFDYGSGAYLRSVIFYASVLNGDSAHLPPCPESMVYHLSYTSNGQTIESLIK